MKVVIAYKLLLLNPFPNKPLFLCFCSTCVMKTLWEKEKLLITSNFSFPHSVFYPFKQLSAIFFKFKIVFCNLLQFGRVYILSFGKGLNKLLLLNTAICYHKSKIYFWEKHKMLMFSGTCTFFHKKIKPYRWLFRFFTSQRIKKYIHVYHRNLYEKTIQIINN